MVKCDNCGSSNPVDIKICLSCGASLKSSVTTDDSFAITFDFLKPDEIENQIRDYFFKIMRFQVESELDTKGYRNYFDHYHKSEFYKKVDIRLLQLAEEVLAIHAENDPIALEKIENYVDQSLRAFLDYFIIVFCEPLHKMKLPESMLRYENVQNSSLDLKQMILDFLDFENEKDKVYFDFINMPLEKLNNAKEAFLSTANDEKIIFICDQTVFGSCKEGYAMSDKALYWKPHFNDPGRVSFKEIKSINLEAEWITINEQFFNVNRTLNYKMTKLLQKIQSLNKQ